MKLTWSIARKLALAMALGPLALIIICTTAYRSTQDLQRARALLNDTFRMQLALSALAVDLAGVRAGEQGYLLTGNQADVASFARASAAAEKDLTGLTKFAASDPGQSGRIEALTALVPQMVQEARQVIGVRRAQGLPAASAAFRARGAGGTAERAFALVREAQEAEGRMQLARIALARSEFQKVYDVMVYGTVATVVLLALIGFFVTRSVSRPLREAVATLNAATMEILTGTTQQSTGVQEQAAAVAQTVTTVEEISQTAQQANDRAKTVADSSRRAADDGSAGRRAVESSIAAMVDVKARTESIAESILTLAEQAQAIGEIIAVVNDMAEQTNLLALNASIEASRAGEHGRGFGVVAAEIKSLAEQSKKATVQVRQILGEIQKATNGAVIATEQGTKTVEEALRTVNEADGVIRSLADVIADAAQSAVQISASAGQQAIGMSQIQQAMRSINQATSQNLASTQQTEQAARNLDAVGVRLRALLHGAAA